MHQSTSRPVKVSSTIGESVIEGWSYRLTCITKEAELMVAKGTY